MATFGTDVTWALMTFLMLAGFMYLLQSAYNGFIEMQSSLVSFYSCVDPDNLIRSSYNF